MIQSGRLRHRVTIQSRTETARDSTGEITQSWADTKTVWASIEPADGTEPWDNQAQVDRTEQPVILRMRYRSGLTAKNRIKRGTVIYDIQSVTNTLERNEELVIKATVHG